MLRNAWAIILMVGLEYAKPTFEPKGKRLAVYDFFPERNLQNCYTDDKQNLLEGLIAAQTTGGFDEHHH